MYSTSTQSTTSSSRPPAAPERRMRVIRLLRPRRSTPAFGFSVRGGNEHAAGFFVSKVEFNSEAHMQGLQVGDQLMSVNGYRVDDAVHSELIHYLATQTRLKVKVRHVGMLPVKEKPHDVLSWQFTSERMSLGSDVSSSPTILHESERMSTNDLRLSILVPPRAKLGCGICKGPEWKPGIFVQFVREGGIAREAGLRPGDQIVACNGKDFRNIPFQEAISVMKAIGRLELIIREGAGAELVSPESSGYNSSASSAAGERSPAAPLAALAPPSALRKKLASVAEEAADRADRLTASRIRRRTWDSLDYDWKQNTNLHNFDAPSDIEPDYDSPSIPNNPHSYENKTKNNQEFVTSPSNRTIINLTEDGATIECYDSQNRNYNNAREEKKTIVVEVHHNNTVQCNFPPPPKMDPNLDTASITSSSTLSSAIAEEIQRRKLKPKAPAPAPTLPNPSKPANAPKLPEDDKKKQHDALMDEFKKVHRRMFQNQENDEKQGNDSGSQSMDRQATLPIKVLDNRSTENLPSKNLSNSNLEKSLSKPIQNGVTNNAVVKKFENGTSEKVPFKMVSGLANKGLTNGKSENATLTLTNGSNNKIIANGASDNGTLKLVNGTANKVAANGTSENSTFKVVNGSASKIVANGNHRGSNDVKDGPPPPPPMPSTNGHQNGVLTKQKSIKEISEELLSNTKQNGTLTRTPTPDYNKGTTFNGQKSDKNGDKAELESIESYKMRNPANVSPRPPSHYFYNAPNGTATMKKLRPGSVTIGEYAIAGSRKEPSKLEFLNGDKSENGRQENDIPITNRLQSELALTLSRSNLRKKTEVSGDAGR